MYRPAQKYSILNYYYSDFCLLVYVCSSACYGNVLSGSYNAKMM